MVDCQQLIITSIFHFQMFLLRAILCDCGSSFSKVEKLLHDSKQYQCCKKAVVMSCSQECSNYLNFCMANSNAISFVFHRRSTEKRLHCDLALSSYPTIKILHVIRIDCESSLKCACGLFSLTFGVGIFFPSPLLLMAWIIISSLCSTCLLYFRTQATFTIVILQLANC